MKGIHLLAICGALSVGSAAQADKTPCPTFEAGAAYPWQTSGMMNGDHYAWVYVDIDRTGRPLQCRIGENNIFDPYTRFQLCNAYTGDWRGPAASPGDPDKRTLKRETVMIGYEHELADKKARREWFRLHPDERQSCYPD